MRERERIRALKEAFPFFRRLMSRNFERKGELFKVARLQNEFSTKDFFRATNFLTKNAPKFSPIFLSLCSVGQKKSRKIPSKFPTKFSKFPCEKSKKIHRRASAGAQEGRAFQMDAWKPSKTPDPSNEGFSQPSPQ